MGNSTIAAIATPLGEGSISVIRISGDNAFSVADSVFKSISGKKISEINGYTALYGEIIDGSEVIDNAVALKFVAPKSYTGENVVEISLHGGRYVVKKVLRLILQNGAVQAAPGEFTKRAFFSGKLDLIEAEAVMGVITAESEAQLKMGISALSGKSSKEIKDIEENLRKIAASVAFFNDNPDEEIPELNEAEFTKSLTEIKEKIEVLLKNYDSGRILREGIDTVILGKPNVGKSTLMNLLSRRERSIVTEIAGTTRDIIEETVMLGDIVLRLSDTAGIRKTEDTVENVGINLAKQKGEEAQLILAVFDLSAQIDNDDMEILNSIKDKNVIVVLNKSDIAAARNTEIFKGFNTVTVSAKNGTGKEALIDAVLCITNAKNLSADSSVLSTERQRECAMRALISVNEALETLTSGITIDAVGVLIDDALSCLYTLTGERVTNTVADEIFERFCVGK